MTEAFVYLWTDFKSRYIGYHKGDENDGYICSASEEFYKAYYSAENWKRRILRRGTKKDMLKLEHEILKRVDAKNNDRYFNKSNGGIYKKEPQMNTDFELVEKVKDVILKKPHSMRPTPDVYKLPKYQTRALSINGDKVNQIAEKIKDAGNIDKMSPIVIVTGLASEYVLDGNHTINAAKKAKVPEVKIVTIDMEELDNNELNLIGLGNMLNHVDIVKTAPSNQDIKQTLIQAKKHGQDITDPIYKRELAKATGRAASAITRMATTVLTSGSLEGVFRIWQKDELLQQKLNRVKEGVSVITHASGSVMTERALGVIIADMFDNENEVGVLIYHHTTPANAKVFDKRRIEAIVESTGKRIHIVELDNVPI